MNQDVSKLSPSLVSLRNPQPLRHWLAGHLLPMRTHTPLFVVVQVMIMWRESLSLAVSRSSPGSSWPEDEDSNLSPSVDYISAGPTLSCFTCPVALVLQLPRSTTWSSSSLCCCCSWPFRSEHVTWVRAICLFCFSLNSPISWFDPFSVGTRPITPLIRHKFKFNFGHT